MKLVYLIRNQPPWRIVSVIFALSILLHIIYVSIAPKIDPVIINDPLYGDAYGYNLLAKNMLSKNIFSWDGIIPTSFRAPGYPAFLALIYAIAGENLNVVRLIQALLVALICVPVFWMGYRLAGLSLAILASLGTVLHPLLLYMTAWIYTEPFFICLLWLGVWLLFRVFQSNEYRYILLAGVILGIATLVRPQFVMLPLGCLILGLIARWSFATIRSFALVQLIVIFVLLPWSIRNYVVHQEIVLITTDTGPNLYGANNRASHGGFASQSWSLPGLSEVQSDKEFARRALVWIRQNPQQFIALIPAKLEKFYSLLEATTNQRSIGRIEPIIRFMYHGFLVIAFFGALWLVFEQKGQESIILVALSIYATLITMIFHGGARLALPIAPVLILFACFLLTKGASLVNHYFSQSGIRKILSSKKSY